jgi:general secretion pathway protein D
VDELLEGLVDQPVSDVLPQTGEAAEEVAPFKPAVDLTVDSLLEDLPDTATGMTPVDISEGFAPESVEPAIEAPASAVPGVAAIPEDDVPAASGETKFPTREEDLHRSAEALATATIVRLRAREKEGLDRLREGFDAMVRKQYDVARALFERALRLIPERNETMDSIQSARTGLADANLEIAQQRLEQRDFRGARTACETALQFDSESRRAKRLMAKLDRIAPGGKEPRLPVEHRSSTIEQRAAIEDLLTEGRDLFANELYEEAAQKFDQVRALDEFNREAVRYLQRIADRRYKFENLIRRQTVTERMADVRGRWNPPLKTGVERPELDSEKGLTQVDVDPSVLIERMRSIIIPSIEFRNANIIDVVDELRRETERVDREQVGVNIVLKLSNTGTAAPFGGSPEPTEGVGAFAPSDNEPFGFFDTPGSGGLGNGVSDVPTFNAPAAEPRFGFDETSVPRITLTLRRISLYDALKIITEYADLKFKIDRNIVFITPRSAVIEPLETRVYAVQPSLLDVVVESADARESNRGDFIEMGRDVQVRRVDVKEFFQRAGVPFPEGTSITYNAATSQLIVRNTLENLEIFERILPNFNIPPTQVEIEARFVEILQEDLAELGIEWILTDDWEIARNTESGAFPANQERLQFDANSLTKGLRFLNAGPAGVEATGRDAVESPSFFGDVISFSSVLTNPELNVILHALSQRGGMDLLSAPRITTRSGVAATIEVVQEIIYPTEFEAESSTSRFDVNVSGEANPDLNLATSVVIYPETFETREVGVILNVTPTVGPDKYTIDLSMAPEVAELVDWIQYGTPPFNIPQPIFASRNATTSIVIWDGQTVVMGGLINETMLRFEDKIPFLGDIPFLGRFFRSQGERSVKRNLLIFVTARIVDPSGNPVNKAKAVAEATLPPAAAADLTASP